MMNKMTTPAEPAVRRGILPYTSRKLVYHLVDQYPFVKGGVPSARGHNYELNEYGLSVLRTLLMQHGAVHKSNDQIDAVLTSNMTNEATLVVTSNRARFEETIRDSNIIELFKKKASGIINSLAEGMTDKHLIKFVYHGTNKIKSKLQQLNLELTYWMSEKEKTEHLASDEYIDNTIERLTRLIGEYHEFIKSFRCRMPHIVHSDATSYFDDVVKMIAMKGKGNCWNLLVNTGKVGQSLLTLNFQGGCIWLAESMLLGMHEIQFIIKDKNGEVWLVENPMLIVHEAAAPPEDGNRGVIQVKYNGCANHDDGQVDEGMIEAVALADSDAYCIAARDEAIQSLAARINDLRSLLTTEPVIGAKTWLLSRMIINESRVFSAPESLDADRDALFLAFGGTFRPQPLPFGRFRPQPLPGSDRPLTVINLSYVNLTNISMTGQEHISSLQFVVLRCPSTDRTLLVNIGDEFIHLRGKSTRRDVYDFHDLGKIPPRRQGRAAPKPDLPESELVNYYLNQKDEQGLIFSRFALYNGATFKIGQTFLKFTVPNTSI
jgi:hypothetical protein